MNFNIYWIPAKWRAWFFMRPHFWSKRVTVRIANRKEMREMFPLSYGK